MTKAQTRAARLRARKARQAATSDAPDPFALEAVPARKSQGRARMKELAHEAKASVLSARARRIGKPTAPHDTVDRPILSDDCGIALHLSCAPEEAGRLWSHYVAYEAAAIRYYRSIGVSYQAKSARLEMMPDSFEVRSDDRPDDRTDDQRDADAASSWSRWCKSLARLTPLHRIAIRTAPEHSAEFVVGGQCTRKGRRFVEAMRALDAILR